MRSFELEMLEIWPIYWSIRAICMRVCVINKLSVVRACVLRRVVIISFADGKTLCFFWSKKDVNQISSALKHQHQA